MSLYLPFLSHCVRSCKPSCTPSIPWRYADSPSGCSGPPCTPAIEACSTRSLGPCHQMVITLSSQAVGQGPCLIEVRNPLAYLSAPPGPGRGRGKVEIDFRNRVHRLSAHRDWREPAVRHNGRGALGFRGTRTSPGRYGRRGRTSLVEMPVRCRSDWLVVRDRQHRIAR
jgi:hypothetical protein